MLVVGFSRGHGGDKEEEEEGEEQNLGGGLASAHSRGKYSVEGGLSPCLALWDRPSAGSSLECGSGLLRFNLGSGRRAREKARRLGVVSVAARSCLAVGNEETDGDAKSGQNSAGERNSQ